MKRIIPIALAVLLVGCQVPTSEAPLAVHTVETDVVVTLASTWVQAMSSTGYQTYSGKQTAILEDYAASSQTLLRLLQVGAIDPSEFDSRGRAINDKKTADLAALEAEKKTAVWWAQATLLVGYSNSGPAGYSGYSALVEFQTSDGVWHPGAIPLRDMAAKGSMTEFYDVDTGGLFITGIRYLRAAK